MMKLLDRKVHLFLTIKNKKGWTDANAIMYQKLGLDFNA
jgi:GTPase Era involved in 16S rRNA processing